MGDPVDIDRNGYLHIELQGIRRELAAANVIEYMFHLKSLRDKLERTGHMAGPLYPKTCRKLVLLETYIESNLPVNLSQE
jgi:hypothetical protein